MNVSENTTTADSNASSTTESMKASMIMQLSLEVIICLLTVSGNLLTILAALTHTSLRKPTNYLIINLAIVDFLVGVFAIPFSTVAESGFPKNSFYGCLIINCVIVTFTQVSFINLLAIALEILVAVKYPLRYRSLFTRGNVSTVCGLLWLFGGLLGFVPLMGWHKVPPEDGRCSFVNVIDLRYWVYVVFFGWSAWIFVVIFAIYAAIFCIIQRELGYRRHRGGGGGGGSGGMISNRRRHTLRTRLGENGGRSSGGSGISKATVKAAKRMSIIVLAFAVAWIPLNIHNVLQVMCKSAYCNYSEFVVKVFILLTHANSAVNPFVYALSHPQFRAAYAALVCCSRARPEFVDASINGGSRGMGGGRGNKAETASAAAAAPTASAAAGKARGPQAQQSMAEPDRDIVRVECVTRL